MTIERAIEILNPAHREHYESIEPVNEACRMGMEALKEKLENDAADIVKVVRCKDCKYKTCDDLFDKYWCNRESTIMQVKPDCFCSWGEK